jgi:hypothetical protein
MVQEVNDQIFGPMAGDLRRFLIQENDLKEQNSDTVPASDRVVRLDHNQPDYSATMQSVDACRANCDIPISAISACINSSNFELWFSWSSEHEFKAIIDDRMFRDIRGDRFVHFMLRTLVRLLRETPMHDANCCLPKS